MFIYREWLIEDLRALPKDKKALETITNPLEYEWKKRSIADRERLLDQLDAQEREIIEHSVINKRKLSVLSKKMDIPFRTIVFIKENAIEKLLYLRHGAAYRP